MTEMTPAQIAENDQTLAYVNQVRDAAALWATGLVAAHDADNAAAQRIAEEHAAFFLGYLTRAQQQYLLLYLLCNTVEVIKLHKHGGDIYAYADSLGGGLADWLRAFLASDGQDCCEAGPGNHAWDEDE